MSNWFEQACRRAGPASALGFVVIASCLPEDTRPPPAVVSSSFTLAAHRDTNLTDGLSVTTVDGYEVTFTRVILSIGRIRFDGFDCNIYGGQLQQPGYYSRVLDALQVGKQYLSIKYAVGSCQLSFEMFPPEDWAPTNGPGVSEQDRDDLRAVEIKGQDLYDDVIGLRPDPRGPRGANLRIEGFGVPLAGNEAPTTFLFEFGDGSVSNGCALNGEDYLELESGTKLELVIEMSPEQILGTCGNDEELRFAPIAAAKAALGVSGPLTLEDLESVRFEPNASSQLDSPLYCSEFGSFYRFLGQAEASDQKLSVQNLSQWLRDRAAIDLFELRGGKCSSSSSPAR